MFEDKAEQKWPSDPNKQRRYRKRKKVEEREAQAGNWDSPNSYDEKEDVKALLADSWNIRNAHVLDTVYELGEIAAQLIKCIPNRFFWTNGPSASAASIAANGPVLTSKPTHGEIVVGEILYRTELFAIYQFSVACRPNPSTFEEFLTLRRVCKTDTMRFGVDILGKDFHEQPHGRWFNDLFFQWNPDLLKPDYSQEDMKAWLNNQSEYKRRLLIASRNSYKSSAALVWLVQGVLCCPDIRLLLISETKPLSRSFLGPFRAYFEIKDRRNPTIFQKLFAEMSIDPETGTALTFESPMAHLDLAQATAESTSMDSVTAGRRADVIHFDDPISNMSVGNDVQRQASVAKYDALLELLEVGGYSIMCGTPWHEDDLSATVLERNEKSAEKPLRFLIDPAWTVLESGRGKTICELEEKDVSLMFPTRLTWKVLQSKLREGDLDTRNFRMQTLCEFLPEVEAAQRLKFSREDLLRYVQSAPAPPAGEIYASSDLAFSRSKYRDMSCFTIFKTIEGAMYVLHQEADHLGEPEKAQAIVRLARQYPGLKTWLLEKYHGWENFENEIKREALKYGTNVRTYWTTADTSKDAKFHRLKLIELALGQGRLKFIQGFWNDALFNELEKLNDTGPKRKSSTIHDDRGDSLSLGLKFFAPQPGDEDAAARKKFEAEQQEKQAMAENYARIFGGQSRWTYGIPTPAAPDPGPPFRGLFNIPGLRPGPQPPSPPLIPHSFGNLAKKHS